MDFWAAAVSVYQLVRKTGTQEQTQPASHAGSNQISQANKQKVYCKTKWRQILYWCWIIGNYNDSSLCSLFKVL